VRRIELFLVPGEIPESYLKDKLAVTIDVLRACTTVAYAFANGAGSAIPAEEVEEATKLLASLDRRSTLLCGERNGLKIKGFDLGNSPLEYTEDVVGGKTLIMASTNGTPAMARASVAKVQLLCSFVNIGLVAEALKGAEGGTAGETDIAIVCSGRMGRMAIEDAVCGGMLVHILDEAGLADLRDGANDAAVAARDLYLRHSESLATMIEECSHGRYLASIGFAADLKICSRLDSVPVLPVLADGVITPGDPNAIGAPKQ
jgi:2-phosphosulfolactate phosphatase